MKSIKEEFLKTLANYQGIIHKVCLLYFRTEVDRKDNFQEIVYQLWKSFPNLKDRDKIASWIYGVAINTSISKIRKDSRLVYQAQFNESLICIDDRNMKDEDLKLLIQAIQKLNEIDKSIILLYLEEYDYEEIATIIGISKSNVGTRINRAKKVLKEHLKNLNYENQ
ncbi:DNA-directed RNA polymerase sigma-70 factor [Bacteroidia bacterium]|nr:DNA-directed RNA polymerase sigma-70 factor [Bacteroidia bacterium]